MIRIKTIREIQLHREALLICTKTLYGTIPDFFWLHDYDKETHPLLDIDYKTVKNIHRSTMIHHLRCKTIDEMTFEEILEAIMDWECAAFTKKDKPLNAYDTLNKYYKEFTPYILPILKQLGIAYKTVPLNLSRLSGDTKPLHPIFIGKPEYEMGMIEVVREALKI